LKLHVLYQPAQDAPVDHSITAVNVNDVCEGRKVVLEQGATYVFDKAYCDYSWWQKISQAKATFVTRAKSNIALARGRRRPVPETQREVILEDRITQFRHASNRGGHRNAFTGSIRRIEVAREDGQVLVLLTNDLKSPARQIAELYKQRWQIELFFKWIKQHLQVKRFMGRSENAVRIQLLVALIVYLLLLLHRARTMPTATLWSLLALFRHGLMNRPEPQESAHVRRRCCRDWVVERQGVLFA
jgi:IS4 transposase